MRNKLARVSTRFRGGLNEEVESANPEQVVACSNVWWKDGKVQTRPGGQAQAGGPIFGISGTVTSIPWLAKSASGVVTTSSLNLSITGLVSGDFFCVGFSSLPTSLREVYVKFTGALAAGSNTQLRARYWNGARWASLPGWMYNEQDEFTREVFIASRTEFILDCAMPTDWATTTLGTQTKYWVRFDVAEDTVPAATIDIANSYALVLNQSFGYFGLFDYGPGRKYVHAFSSSGTAAGPEIFSSLSSFGPYTLITRTYSTSSQLKQLRQRPSTAVFAETGDLFIALDDVVYRFADGYSNIANVDTRDAVTGSGAPADKNNFAQLSGFPSARFVLRHDRRMFFVEGDTKVGWTLAAPYHRVLPAEAFEYVGGDDNSDITSLTALGEHVVIFKRKSIWVLVPEGIDAFGVASYTPKQVVNGVGCVSHGSVQEVRGELVFLSADGLYAFNGVSARKVSEYKDRSGNVIDRLVTTMNSIDQGKREMCSSVNWRSERCYLLSVSSAAGTANDLTICWQYDRDVFWLWSGFDAQAWLATESASGVEELYYVSSAGALVRLGTAKHDNGAAISASLTSAQLYTDHDGTRVEAREVLVNSGNKARTLTVEVLASDETSGETKTISLTDPAEIDWGTLQWSTTNPDNWADVRERERFAGCRRAGPWFQVKITHNQKDQPLSLSKLSLGVRPTL